MQPLDCETSAPATPFMGWSNLLQGAASSNPHRMHSQVPIHAADERLPDDCLLLSVTTGVFDEIRVGVKTQEYRPHNSFWKRRVVGKHFTHVAIVCGQNKSGKALRTMVFEWSGYEVKTIQQARGIVSQGSEGGQDTAKVFAVNLVRGT